jgi:hypothetical protein
MADKRQLPPDIKPKAVVIEKEGLRVTCEKTTVIKFTPLIFSGENDEHISFYQWKWLFKHRINKSGHWEQFRRFSEGVLP